MIVLLGFSFMIISFKSARTENANMNKLLEQYTSENHSLPVTANPLEISTEINVDIAPNYFMEYKLERDRIRSRQIEILREIVNNPNSVSENRMEAQQRLFLISGNMERELELENLLAAKGFDQTAALIQPSSVTIVVGKTDLKQEEVAKISDFAVKTTGYKIEDVVIVPLEKTKHN